MYNHFNSRGAHATDNYNQNCSKVQQMQLPIPYKVDRRLKHFWHFYACNAISADLSLFDSETTV